MAGGSPEHRRVLRKVFAAEGGVEVDTRGDAFFYVFTDARAFAAGAAANVALEPGLIRIRMGLHTGEALLTEEGYVGEDVRTIDLAGPTERRKVASVSRIQCALRRGAGESVWRQRKGVSNGCDCLFVYTPVGHEPDRSWRERQRTNVM
jgi:hypothetical protein